MSAAVMGHGALGHNAAFAERLRRGDTLLGTFVKTPHPAVVEVLGRSGLDFLILDAEHAPFDRTSIDLCLLAAQAGQCPTLVRVPAASPEWIMSALDAGAAGIMAPHVSTPQQAREIAAMMRYSGGERGFSPSPRAGEYGTRTIATHLELAPSETVLVCQIEDHAGVEAADAIAATDGVDALFVGPVDLAVSLGLDSAADDRVTALCRRTIAAAAPDARAGLFVANMESARAWRDHGATLIVSGSDQAMLRAGAKAIAGGLGRAG